jgi:hypothetical protein
MTGAEFLVIRVLPRGPRYPSSRMIQGGGAMRSYPRR